MEEARSPARLINLMRPFLFLLLIPLLTGADTRPPRPRQEVPRYRLEIHVPEQAGIYFTAWADGDAIADHDGSDNKVVVYHRYFVWYDGCVWTSTETLTPVAADQYKYSYRERPTECPKGLTGDVNAETPREGTVSVFPIADTTKPLTSLTAWARGWEKARN